MVGINFKTFVQNLQDSNTEIAGITIHTVESALLVEDQCSWFTWVTFAHEFTYARTNIQAFVLYSLKLFRLHYQQNYVPPKKRKFWLPTNIDPYELNDFKVTCIYINNRYRYLYASISWTLKVPDLVLIEN